MNRRKQRLTAADIQGAWAIIPTPSTDDASDWRAKDTVDLDEAARAVEAMIAAGIDGILSLGTLGECGTLDWEEKRAFMATLVETARGRVPVFGGTTSSSTRETVRRTRAALDLGVDGTMVGPGMWNRMDTPGWVRFYKDIAEAVPQAAICIYANPAVFKFDFPPPFWTQVAEIPQVVSAKVFGHATLLRDLRATRGKIRLMPLDSEYYGGARLAPEACTAFWSSSASCGPAPVIALRDRVAKARVDGDWSAAGMLSDEMAAATLPIICYGDLLEFQTHNTALEKLRMDAAGWMKAGPIRPPYHVVPEKIRQYAETGGRMWAELQRKYG